MIDQSGKENPTSSLISSNQNFLLITILWTQKNSSIYSFPRIPSITITWVLNNEGRTLAAHQRIHNYLVSEPNNPTDFNSENSNDIPTFRDLGNWRPIQETNNISRTKWNNSPTQHGGRHWQCNCTMANQINTSIQQSTLIIFDKQLSVYDESKIQD